MKFHRNLEFAEMSAREIRNLMHKYGFNKEENLEKF